jgi:hypothetical protein
MVREIMFINTPSHEKCVSLHHTNFIHDIQLGGKYILHCLSDFRNMQSDK